MDLTAQQELATELEHFLSQKFKGEEFQVILSSTNNHSGFAFTIGTLTEFSSFDNCSLIVNGIAEEAQALTDRFKIPSNTKLKKPIEPKG